MSASTRLIFAAMIPDYNEKVCACALGHIFGYEPKYSAELVRRLGSASAVFGLDADALFGIFGPHSAYRDRISPAALDESAAELENLYDRGFSYVAFSEPEYPALLRECPDPPAGLYVRAVTPVREIFNVRPMVAVVGTRDMSLYGKEWCPRIIDALSCSGKPPAIVSGLAFGVDITAQLAALSFGLPTVGVMATGVDMVYPRAHSVAAEKIAGSEGSALVTDYPPGTSPVAVNFIRRNRIIAGMCSAVILVESKRKGGGTMTARLAADYGRDVFVLPGRIDDLRSEGCNLLVAEKIAEPVANLSRLPVALGLGDFHRRPGGRFETEIAERYGKRMPPEDYSRLCSVAEAIRRHRGITLDDLCACCGLKYQEVSNVISILEGDSLVSVDLLGRCTISCLRV